MSNGIDVSVTIKVAIQEPLRACSRRATVTMDFWGETAGAALANAVRLIPATWEIDDAKAEPSRWQVEQDERAALAALGGK